MAAVNVIYHHFPHYRRSVMRELAIAGVHEYRFWGSVEDYEGVKAFAGDDKVKIEPLEFVERGKVWALKGYWPALWDRSADALIVIGNPNMPASWILGLGGRLLGKKVLFWTHGWLRREGRFKTAVRSLYYRLADIVLVYGERAKALGLQAGFAPHKIVVVYNSVDFEGIQREIEKIERGDLRDMRPPRDFFENPALPMIICTARLTPLCRFDLLLEAAHLLAERGTPINILLVGDGPERHRLQELSIKLGVKVHFFGACHEEETLAHLIYNADLTVSPGKIGLTAIHSLSYGTPAITHGNMNEQMPEVEAIEPGKSGLLFKQGDVADLARAMKVWLSLNRDRSEIRRNCQEIVARKWNPTRQREAIDRAISSLVLG